MALRLFALIPPAPMRRAGLAVAGLGAALVLAGCQSGRSPSASHQVVVGSGNIPVSISNPETAETDPHIAAARSDITVVTYSGPHGTQVSYHSPAGKVFLWYPGNTVVLQGEWKAARPQQLCYRYPTNTINLHAHQPGGKWVCRAAVLMVFGLGAIHERKGDVFGLSRRSAPPFVTQKGPEQLKDIVAKLPPETPQDKPNRLSRAASAASSEDIARREQKLWEQVGQPPAGQEAGTDATPEQ